MIIGAMNHPQRDVVNEIASLAKYGMQFLDLTLEPPAAAAWQVDPAAIRRALEDHRMGVVGHTAYYLPLSSAFESVRKGAVDELRRCLDVFAEVGAKWMNLHPHAHAPMHDRAFIVQQNAHTIEDLMERSRACGVGIMVENVPGDFNDARQLGELLDPLPEIGLHLDIGHCNLQVPHNTTEEILAAYGSRLRHVHLHDNNGGQPDLHLPLGAGHLDLPRHVKSLKDCGYDGTITLEVFSPDKQYLVLSRDILRRLWDQS